jgi:hypothetical protein
MKRLTTIAVFILLTACTVQAERDRLYSKTDPAATGGIKGSIITPSQSIVSILAVPPDEPRLVYEGKVLGTDKREFLFENLPMRKYDLMVIYENAYYEGFNLMRGESTLTEDDLAKINATVAKAEKYFLKKFVYRVEGETGRGNEARAVVGYLRDTASTNGSDHRRTVRLIMFKDVGPGYQIVRTRDLYPTWTKPQTNQPKHHYVKELGRIRVTDEIKDVGGLRLSSN